MKLLGRIAQSLRFAANPSAWYLTRRAIYGYQPERDGASLTPPDPGIQRDPMSLAAYAACIRVLSEDIGKLPVRVIRREGRVATPLTDSPVYALVARRPNPFTTSQAFREALMADALSWGNGYAWIERNSRGDAEALWPISAHRVEVVRDGRTIRYKVRAENPPDGIPAVLFPDEMLHIRNLGNAYVGHSVCALAAGTIELAMSTEIFGTTLFRNGAMARAVIELPPGQIMDKEAADRFMASWRQMHAGADNTNRVVLMPSGMQLKPISIPNDQAQFLETRQFQVTEICRWFRIPPHMVASLDKATFSNIEEQARGYVTEALMPWVKRWESELEAKLLNKEPGTSIALELKGLLRGTHKDRAEYYSKLFQMGAITPNEIRDLEDMNPVPDGDKAFVQTNLTTLENAGKLPEPAPAPTPTPEQEDSSDEQAS